MNYGFNPKKEKEEQSPTDWVLGAKTPMGMADEVAGLVLALHAWSRRIVNGIYQKTNNAWNHCVISYIEKFSEYYPKGEVQNLGGEKMDCVTRGFINEIEKQLNYLYKTGKMSLGLINWLERKGFFKDGVIVLSNRIPAIMSGTSKNGNSLKAVIQWIENNGIHPRIIPEDVPMTFNQYHDKSAVTKEVLDIGIESRDLIKINYAKVYIRNFLRYFGNFKWKIFDNYLDRGIAGDFVKHLAENYSMLEYAYRIIINLGEPEEVITQEITTEEVRKVWSLRPDLQTAFPASNKFISIYDPHYTIYHWVRDRGVKEHPEIFTHPKHKTFIYSAISWLKSFLKGKEKYDYKRDNQEV